MMCASYPASANAWRLTWYTIGVGASNLVRVFLDILAALVAAQYFLHVDKPATKIVRTRHFLHIPAKRGTLNTMPIRLAY